MSELKLIFTGAPGAGKTTAITAISEFEPISTDMATTDALAEQKEETTVAMDFGEITLDDGERVRLYGTPGQERFEFMWKILIEGGLGLIILVDNSRPDPIADLAVYINNFRDFIEETSAVIGITRADLPSKTTLDDYYSYLETTGLPIPIMEADVREKDDVLMLLDLLISSLEYK